MKYEIWMEGFLVTGMEGIPAPAKYLGRYEGSDFRQACIKFATSDTAKGFGEFNINTLSFWGCGLFDNESDARKSFG